MAQRNGIGPVVSFPVIEIAGLSYSLKFGPGAQLRMERMGWPQDKLLAAYTFEEQDGERKVVHTSMPLSILFAWIAATAGQMIKGKWRPIELTAEEIADVCTPEDIENFSKGISEMFSKAKPDGEQPAPEPANPTPTASSIS